MVHAHSVAFVLLPLTAATTRVVSAPVVYNVAIGVTYAPNKCGPALDRSIALWLEIRMRWCIDMLLRSCCIGYYYGRGYYNAVAR